MNKIETLLELLEAYIVEIPIVQRDYAQGRNDDHATLVRSNLLFDMKKAIEGQTPPLDLNFVYGKEVKGKFIPLDGQQRLTTLFLLHLFAFRNDEAYSSTLHKFTYETRKSSRKFFDALIDHRKEVLSGKDKVSLDIIDATWFLTEWKHDPTVQSALTVLDDIANIFSNVNNLSERLVEKNDKPLIFQFLEMNDLGMEDSLYIKLNARGKPLTSFENFKARLFAQLSRINKNYSKDFEVHFDGKWTDLFWKKFTNSYDASFLNFFQVLFTNSGIGDLTPNDWANRFEFEKLDEKMFMHIQDILNAIDSNYPKIGELIFAGVSKDSTYYDRLLFHAVTEYIKASKGIIDESFNAWIRVTSNLIINSTIDNPQANVAAIKGLTRLSEYSSDIISYLANGGEISGFAREQGEEEINKAKIISANPNFAASIYAAENNNYFTGKVKAALNFAYKEGNFDKDCFNTYWNKIISLFDDNGIKYDHLVRQALLTYSDYTIRVGSYNTLCVNDRREAGSTPSIKRLFSDYPNKIQGLLDALDTQADIETQLKEIVSASKVEQNDWRYCFIKYPQIFSYMSVSHLRISKRDERILVIQKKSTSGYNIDLYLTALSIALNAKGVENQQRAEEQGAKAKIFLDLMKDGKEVYQIEYVSGKFILKSKTKYKLNNKDNESSSIEFSGITMIDDAVDSIVSLLS